MIDQIVEPIQLVARRATDRSTIQGDGNRTIIMNDIDHIAVFIGVFDVSAFFGVFNRNVAIIEFLFGRLII